MRIVFFSTNSNSYEGEFASFTLPECRDQWQEVAALHPEHEIIIATQLPGNFLLDLDGGKFSGGAEKIKYVILKSDDAEMIADEIALLKPDFVFAASFWVAPFDWLPVKDSLIGELLSEKGIRAICHPSESALDCFDKFRTNIILKELGINVAAAVYVNHELFLKTKKGVNVNVYRELVLKKIRRMHFPLIIKDTVGLSSYGMQVVEDYRQAEYLLTSKRNNSDRIVEEYIPGIQFGTEIYGCSENYKVMPPFMFSVNRYGITSPKQSVKFGPVTNPEFKFDELEKILLRIAGHFSFNGIAQFDLVFSNGKWFVIEINPRISGMTSTYAAALGMTPARLIFEVALLCSGNESDSFSHEKSLTMNFKFPVIPKEKMQQLKELPFVKYLNQIENLVAKQERETGYCESVISDASTPGKLLDHLEEIKNKFPEIIEPVFWDNAKKMLIF